MATATPVSITADEQLQISDEDDRLFLAIEDYCWEDDPEFQSGLTHILSTSPPPQPSEIRTLTRQAKCFFYSRKIQKHISYSLYSQWLDREEASGIPRCKSPSCEVGPPSDPTPVHEVSKKQQIGYEKTTPMGSIIPTPDGSSSNNKEEEAVLKTGAKTDAPYPTSFAQIVELITTGKPIPGIREIPNTLNTAPPSRNVAVQRRKPWEVSTSVLTGGEENVAVGAGGSLEGSLPSPAQTPL